MSLSYLKESQSGNTRYILKEFCYILRPTNINEKGVRILNLRNLRIVRNLNFEMVPEEFTGDIQSSQSVFSYI